MKWYKTLFYHFIDIAVVNAFVLHQGLSRRQGQAPMRHLQFREKLIEQLVDTYSTSTVAAHKSPSASNAPTTFAKPPPVCGNHLPGYFTPGLVTDGKRRTVKNCKHCAKRTPIFCRTCQVALCLTTVKDCFVLWHRGPTNTDVKPIKQGLIAEGLENSSGEDNEILIHETSP